MNLIYLLAPFFAIFARGKWLYAVTFLAFIVSLNTVDQSWGVYHYHIGSKYFKEVGYFDLYECSAQASSQYHLYRRNLRTYGFTNALPECNQSAFTAERWREFQLFHWHDIRFHNGMMRDKGLNATPSWIFIGERLANLPVSFLVWLDVLALGFAFWFAARHVGWRQVTWAVLFLTTFVGTLGRLWGHFGQWWWLALLIIGWTLMHNRKNAGGLLVGLSASLAIFPIFLMLGRNRREVLWSSVGLLAGLIVGAFTSRGLAAYPEFIENMLLHSSVIRSEPYNIGLFNQLALFRANDLNDYFVCFRGGLCQETYHHIAFQWWWLLAGLPLLLTMHGRIFALLTLSRYYWQMLILVPLFGSERERRWLFICNFAVYLFMAVDRDASWQYSGIIWCVYFALPFLQVLYSQIPYRRPIYITASTMP